MLRTCPRCGDFYADDSLLFCLADGTPLADVDPHAEAWAEGTRVVEEKGRVLRRLTRRLLLRRILMMTTTVLITTTVIFVVAVNTYVYLAPQPDAPVVAAVLTPSPTPTPTPSETPTMTPTPDSPSTLPFVPAFTPTPTPSPTPTPTPSCTARDRQRVIDAIEATQKAEWETAIEGERDAIKRAHMPDGAIRPSVTLLKPTYAFKFSKTCAPLSVTASYTWLVKWADSPRMPGGEKTIGGAKTFACKKDGAAWRCG
jgi:hypothetical protein